jgi:SOS-response transcriptional repressor LexA
LTENTEDRQKLPTAAQLKVLRLLDADRPPTMREIQEVCGYASIKAVQDHIYFLKRKGLVHQPWGENTSRGWALTEAGKKMTAVGR